MGGEGMERKRERSRTVAVFPTEKQRESQKNYQFAGLRSSVMSYKVWPCFSTVNYIYKYSGHSTNPNCAL